MACLVAIAGSILAGGLRAQTADSTAVIEIWELGARIVASPEGLRVKGVTPAPDRLEKYQDVDMKPGDRIVSVNGQRIGTLDDLRKILEAAKAGETIRIGSIRTSGPVMAEYVVAGEDDRKAVRRVVKVGDGDEAEIESGPGRHMIKLKADEHNEPCPELSVVFGDEKGFVEVTQLIPMPPQIPASMRFVEGDVVKSIQGKKVTRARELTEEYDKFKTGDSITVVFVRDGKEFTKTFAKPKPIGGIQRVIKKTE